MNLKTRTKTVSKLLLWYLSNKKKKTKLSDKNKKYFLYEEGKTEKEKEKTKLSCYEPLGPPIGAYFITSGLHPTGVDHPQFQDLCFMLASLGYIVYAPYMLDYRLVYINKNTFNDYVSAFDRAQEHLSLKKLNFKMNIFSISFGSLMALKLASDKKRRDLINSLIIFGGFGDWRSTCDDIMEKALFGKEKDGYGDLRSIPAIYSHLVEFSPEMGDLKIQEKLRTLWLEYITITWPDDTYTEKKKCKELSEKLSKELPPEEKSFFMKGLGLEEGSFQLYEKLAQKGNFDHLDPLVKASEITCPLYLLHGKYDKLIDSSQQKVIKRAVPQRLIKRQILTKLYAHSKRNNEGSSLMRFFHNIPEIKNVLSIILTLSLPNSHSARRKKP